MVGMWWLWRFCGGRSLLKMKIVVVGKLVMVVMEVGRVCYGGDGGGYG
jgi:hypothetical protein